MRHLLFPLAVLVVGVTSVAAQNVDAITERKATLKEFGKATKPVGAMFKGEEPFDLAPVQAALKLIQDKGAKLPALFPDDSKTGAETDALPVIWEEKADFEARFKKLVETAAAAEASIVDEASFPDTWKDLMGNCSGCHKKFRKPKS